MTGFLFNPTETNEAALAALKLRVINCDSCGLCSTRKQAVFGVGKSDRPWVAFVGEAPGENEDDQGLPFVGRAGGLLTDMIAAMGLTREEVYIANSVNCRPPGNRKPELTEVDACRPHLLAQLKIVRPRYIVALGATAAMSLLKKDKAIKDLRGFWFDWEGVKTRVTYHPAYLLRNAGAKKLVWEDLKAVMAWITRDKNLEKGSDI